MNTLVEIDRSWPQALSEGLAGLRLSLRDDQAETLLAYLGLLRKWNRAFNLSAVRDPSLMVRRHLLDSLSISNWVTTGPVLDVGTGAGLPGIPLAIAHPGLRFTLLDSNGKKTRFVQQAVGELGLANVEVIKARVESLARPGYYAVITSRAFAGLAEMVTLTRPLLRPDGIWLAMKGADPVDELAALPPDLQHEVIGLHVPGETAGRHLVILRPTA